MICDNCVHNAVCRFVDRAAEINEIAENIEKANDPWRIVPECIEYKTTNAVITRKEQ